MGAREVKGPSEDLVKLYMADIGRYPLLDKAEEMRLAKAIEAGREAAETVRSAPGVDRKQQLETRRLVLEGERAHEIFVRANLRLVVSIAKRYQASGLPLLDIVQEGNLGLIHAVDKFDWRKGFKFSTYATWWIRQAISRGIANTGRTIRLPVHASDKLHAINQARSLLTGRLGRRPTVDELASEAMMPGREIVEALGWHAEPLSLSAPLSGESDSELGDLVAVETLEASPFEAATASLLPGEVEKLLEPLDDREATIVRLRFGLDSGQGRTLEEVGKHFSLTRERIRQIEAKAMSKLRHPSTRNEAIRGLLPD